MSLVERLDAIHTDISNVRDLLETDLNLDIPDDVIPVLLDVMQRVKILKAELSQLPDGKQRVMQLFKLIELVSDDVPQTYQAILDFICQVSNANYGLIIQYNPTNNQWQETFQNNPSDRPKDTGLFPRIFDVIPTLEDMYITNNVNIFDDVRDPHEARVGYWLRMICLLPLWIDNQIIGVLYLDRIVAERDPFWLSDYLEFMRPLGHHIGHAIMLSQCLADNKKD